MARLASQSKLGYYPTPTEVISHLRRSLRFETGTRILDPCCGSGEAIEQLTTSLPVNTYGIELEQNRVLDASKRLHSVLWGDALRDVPVAYNQFDLIYLNPPYDFEDGGDEKSQRLEFRFLRRLKSFLARKGLMIMVFPLSALKSEALVDQIARFKDLEIFAFPGDLYEAFKQLVIVGRKDSCTKAAYEEQARYLEKIAGMPAAEVPAVVGTTERLASKEYKVALVHAEQQPFRFESHRFDPVTVDTAQSGALAKALAFLEPPTMQKFRPLSSLRQGHLGMVVVSGQCNGLLITDTDEHRGRMLVQGYVRSSSKTVEEMEDDGTTISRTTRSYKAGLRVLYVDQAKIVTITQGEDGEEETCHAA